MFGKIWGNIQETNIIIQTKSYTFWTSIYIRDIFVIVWKYLINLNHYINFWNYVLINNNADFIWDNIRLCINVTIKSRFTFIIIYRLLILKSNNFFKNQMKCEKCLDARKKLIFRTNYKTLLFVYISRNWNLIYCP